MKMKNILRTMPAKIIIYLLTCIMMITTLISVGIGIGCYEIGLYDHTPEELLQWEIDERTLDFFVAIKLPFVGVMLLIKTSLPKFYF